MDEQGRVQIGIFVGGRSARMGEPKGLVRSASGERLLERLVRIAATRGEVVLVGDASPYAGLGLRCATIADRPPGIGPLGGLAGLLDAAGDARVLALSCDLPDVDEAALDWLRASEPDAPILAARAREDAPFEPLFARYDAALVRPFVRRAIEAGAHSLQALLRAAGAVGRAPPRPSVLRDWDTPEDVRRGGGRLERD